MNDLTTKYGADRAFPPSVEYPFSRPKNSVNPNDGLGTPWEQAFASDIWGFMSAIANAGGVTASGNDETATNSQIFDAMQQLFVGGEVGSKLRLFAASVSHDGTEWVLDDNAINVDSIEVLSGGQIRLSHPTGATAAVYASSNTNEFMLSRNVTSSVLLGTSTTTVRLHAKVSFKVNLTTDAITAPAHLAPFITIGTGNLPFLKAVVHPLLQCGNDPSVSVNTSDSGVNQTAESFTTNSDGGSVSLRSTGPLSGLISYDASISEWSYSGEFSGDFTFNFNTTTFALTVTHPAGISVGRENISLSPDSALGTANLSYLPYVEAVTETSFTVRFVSPVNGQVVTSADNQMRFHFVRDGKVNVSTPLNGEFDVARGVCNVGDPNSMVISGQKVYIFGAHKI